MTDDDREAGTVYPMFSVRLVTWRMIIEKQELFTLCFQWGSLHDGRSKRSKNCLSPVFSEVRYMTDDHREAGTVYPWLSVRLVTWRMIIEKQELFILGFQWGSLHDGWSYRDRNCLSPFSVRFVTWRMILETGTVSPGLQWGSLHDGWS